MSLQGFGKREDVNRMDILFAKDLFTNMAMLLSASILSNYIYALSLKNHRFKELLIGLTNGLIGILLLVNTVRLNSWIVFDTRSILISLTALYFGPVPALVAAPIIIAYRIYMGGAGAVPGVLVTIATMFVGLMWRRRRRASGGYGASELYLIGLVTHIFMLLCMFSLPLDRALEVLRSIALPVLVLFPLGTVLMGLVIGTRLRQIEAENAIREQEAQLRIMYEQAPVGVAMLEGRKVLRANHRYTMITGDAQGDEAKFTCELVKAQLDSEAEKAEIEAFQMGAADQYSTEKRLIMPSGNVLWTELTVRQIDPPGSGARRAVCLVQDVTERRLRDEALLNAMTRDGLTGAFNRSYMDLERQNLESEENLPVSLILCDVDGLKLINDVYGYEEGDALLRDVARVLMEIARPQDMVVRYGGDEFLLLMPRTNLGEVYEVCERIQSAFQTRAGNTQAAPRYSSVSIGYAHKTLMHQPLSDVIRNAEQFLSMRKLLAKKSMHNAILSSIKATLYEKSNETEEHCERMARWARALGEAMGLSGEPLDRLELGAYLHDIGKVRIDSSILKKPGKLSASEWEEIKKHPEAGYRIACSVPELQNVADLILCHHEKWDGTGYPRFLAGEEIPLLARIIALVDAYDAMTTDRSYQRALTKEEAIAEIHRCAGSHFDQRIAETFIERVL